MAIHFSEKETSMPYALCPMPMSTSRNLRKAKIDIPLLLLVQWQFAEGFDDWRSAFSHFLFCEQRVAALEFAVLPAAKWLVKPGETRD